MGKLKVGSIVYATYQGLGVLAKSFYDNGVVTKVTVLEHRSRETHWNWYPDSPNITNINQIYQKRQIKEFCRSCDVMLFFETPFDWELIKYCQAIGVKTFLMTMYECTPAKLPACPDYYICPSLLDIKYFPKENSIFIPVPVDMPWKLRTKAEVFVHNAGHGGLKGRNGTAELIEALKYVKSPAKFIIRSQDRNPSLLETMVNNLPDYCKLTVDTGSVPFEELYSEGDVFVFPEKFNGLSLPLQEAHASGMLVMATNRFPMSSWLPNEPLIPSSGSRRESVSSRCMVFDEAIIDPVDIAETIDSWYGRDISHYSQAGKQWAKDNSWERLKPIYMEYLSQ